MSLHNLIEYSNNYSKTAGSLWQCYKDEPVEENVAVNNSKSFKYNAKITGKKSADGITKEVKIEVPLQYFSNFWRILEMYLINC